MPFRKYWFYKILYPEYPEFSVDGLLKKIIQFPNFLGVFPRKVPFHSQSFPNFRSIMFEWKETQDFTYRWISGGKEDGKRR